MAKGVAVVAESEFEDREPGPHETEARAQTAIHVVRSLRGDRTDPCLVAAPGQQR